MSARGPRPQHPCRVTGGRPPARGRGPAENSGSFSGPAPCCPPGWTSAPLRLSEPGPGTALGPWPCLGPAASRGPGSSRRRWLSKTPFSSPRRWLCLEPLSSLRRLSPPAERSSGTRNIYWGCGLRVQARFRLKCPQQTAARSPQAPCLPGPPSRGAALWAQSPARRRLHLLLG